MLADFFDHGHNEVFEQGKKMRHFGVVQLLVQFTHLFLTARIQTHRKVLKMSEKAEVHMTLCPTPCRFISEEIPQAKKQN